MTNKICKACGWVHFGLTRAAAEAQTSKFGNYICNQSDEVKANFGFGPLSKSGKEWSFMEHVSQYERCFNCGGSFLNFRDVVASDHVPVGCTIQGIIEDSISLADVYREDRMDDIRNIAIRAYEADFNYFAYKNDIYRFEPDSNYEEFIKINATVDLLTSV